MLTLKSLEQLWRNLGALGARRLSLLAIVGLAVALAISAGSYLLTRPDMETLYTGLSSGDAARIGAVLREAGITFDVASDGGRVLVRIGQAAQARALLAERGLPGNGASGYELFDKLGPMSLTSFMQEVTRVRALEGEIARTIQGMRGIKSARVHIVLPESSSFRRAATPPSASVVIRLENTSDISSVQAIRHLVTAAVPGMTLENVRILNADGAVLAAGGAQLSNAPSKLLELQQSVSANLQDNIRRTLTPHLGLENFEVSVAVRLNVDRRTVNETKFEPGVERSTSVQRETGTTQTGSRATSVVESIPGEQSGSGGKDQTSKSKKIETTQYDVGSVSSAVVSEGYRVENITVAVVINRKQLAALTGSNPDADAITKSLAEVEKLAGAAAGLETARGDKITVAALDFAGGPSAAESPAHPGVLSFLYGHAGSILNGLLFVVVSLGLIVFGLRPVATAILRVPQELPQIGRGGEVEAIQTATALDRSDAMGPNSPLAETISSGELAERRRQQPQKRLRQMVEIDQEQSVAIIRRWIREGAAQ